MSKLKALLETIKSSRPLQIGLVAVMVGMFVFVPVAHAGIADQLFAWIPRIINLIAHYFIFLLLKIATYCSYIAEWSLSLAKLVQEDAVSESWKIMRDLVNYMFVLVLLMISLANIIGFKINAGYGVKAFLPKLILAVVLVNFSKLICMVILDLANVLEATLYQFLTRGQVCFHGLPCPGKDKSLVELYAELTNQKGLQLTGRTGGSATGQGQSTSATQSEFGLLILNAVLAFIAILFIFMYLIMAVIYFVRTLYLILLVIGAPFWMLTWCVPFLQQYGNKWFGAFTKYAFMHVLFAFFLGVGYFVTYSFMTFSDVANVTWAGAQMTIEPRVFEAKNLVAVALLVGFAYLGLTKVLAFQGFGGALGQAVGYAKKGASGIRTGVGAGLKGGEMVGDYARQKYREESAKKPTSFLGAARRRLNQAAYWGASKAGGLAGAARTPTRKVSGYLEKRKKVWELGSVSERKAKADLAEEIGGIESKAAIAVAKQRDIDSLDKRISKLDGSDPAYSRLRNQRNAIINGSAKGPQEQAAIFQKAQATAKELVDAQYSAEQLQEFLKGSDAGSVDEVAVLSAMNQQGLGNNALLDEKIYGQMNLEETALALEGAPEFSTMNVELEFTGEAGSIIGGSGKISMSELGKRLSDPNLSASDRSKLVAALGTDQVRSQFNKAVAANLDSPEKLENAQAEIRKTPGFALETMLKSGGDSAIGKSQNDRLMKQNASAIKVIKDGYIARIKKARSNAPAQMRILDELAASKTIPSDVMVDVVGEMVESTEHIENDMVRKLAQMAKDGKISLQNIHQIKEDKHNKMPTLDALVDMIETEPASEEQLQDWINMKFGEAGKRFVVEDKRMQNRLGRQRLQTLQIPKVFGQIPHNIRSNNVEDIARALFRQTGTSRPIAAEQLKTAMKQYIANNFASGGDAQGEQIATRGLERMASILSYNGNPRNTLLFGTRGEEQALKKINKHRTAIRESIQEKVPAGAARDALVEMFKDLSVGDVVVDVNTRANDTDTFASPPLGAPTPPPPTPPPIPPTP